MSVWWKFAYILTPSLSFAIGISVGITNSWVTFNDPWGLEFHSFKILNSQKIFTALFYSFVWGFCLASISTITLTIVLCNKKPWKKV